MGVLVLAVVALAAAAAVYVRQRQVWQRALVAERAARFTDRVAAARSREAWEVEAGRRVDVLLAEVERARAAGGALAEAERIVDGALAGHDQGEG